MKSKWINIVSEMRFREFDSRLLFGLCALNNGYSFTIGSQEIYNSIDKMPKGLFFEKSGFPPAIETYRRILYAGNKLFCLNEEGLASTNSKSSFHYLFYKKNSISNQIYNIFSKFFCWGTSDYNSLTQEIGKNKKIHITGSQRVDFLKHFKDFYTEDVKKIKENYGNFLLINTNFTHLNNIQGPNFNYLKFLERISLYKFFNAKNEYEDIRNNDNSRFIKYLHLINILSREFPGKNFVLRPHPTENINFYKEFFLGSKNIIVSNEESSIPMILASDALIFSKCTTGIESFFLEKPSINYVPNFNAKFDTFISNELPNFCLHIDQVINLVRKKNYKYSKKNLFDERIKESRYLNSQNIVNHLSDIKINHHDVSSAQRIIWEAEILIKNTKKIIFPLKMNFKWPKKLDINSFKKMIKKIVDIHNLKFKDVNRWKYPKNVKKINNFTFLVE
jgi:surface carbohydrate biosynthesis protein